MIAAGMPRSWYPVALSRDLARGPVPLCVAGRDFVVYRGRDAPHAVGRYCLHMGADLARSRIEGDRLVCGLHGWPYEGDGSCHRLRAVADGGSAPRLPTLPAIEVAGVVYVWPGPTPDWPFPDLASLASAPSATPRAETLDCPVDAINLNGFDASHYATVHKRQLDGPAQVEPVACEHIRLKFTARVGKGRLYDNLMVRAGYGRLSVQLDYWGGTLIFVRNTSGGYMALIALAPEGEHTCRAYLTCYLAGQRETVTLLQTLALRVHRAVAWRFLREDVPFVSGMRPTEGALVPRVDDPARAFWSWRRSLPEVRCWD